MGDECFGIVVSSISDMSGLEKLHLNVTRNMISTDTFCMYVDQLQNLRALQNLEFEAKRNVRAIEEKQEIKAVFNSLLIKSKKIDL